MAEQDQFEYETAVKWLRIDEAYAGTDVFAVNPKDWVPPRADNGEYWFTGCDFRHGLRVKPCTHSSDCDEPLACQSGVCR